jgi:glycosyltransferase involved in cell wall biosynthesis
VHDLAGNPVGRAIPLALALQPVHEVEILGLLMSGPDVYAPYRGLFPYKTLRCSFSVPSVLSAITRLAAMATGDVLYACKPLLTSLGPALLARRRTPRRRLVLDVEDDEWISMGTTWPQFVWRDLVRGWRHATAWKYTRLLDPFARCVDATVVSSRMLQRRYGGLLVRHGPDEAVFDPEHAELADSVQCRREFELPSDGRLAVFAATPRPHKGLPTLVDALRRPECADWHLGLAGPAGDPDFQDAAHRLGPRCHLLGMVSYARMPRLLAAADVVPVPQRDVPFARSQVPAKLLDAMAMGKPIVASRVGDLPEILGDGKRGWLFKPDRADELAAVLALVASEPMEAARRGAEARRWFLREASASAIRSRLVPVISDLLGVSRF